MGSTLDARTNEPDRAPRDGLGLIARVALLVLAVACLAGAIAGGLARLGVPHVSIGLAAPFHGALMVAGFLGTVIGLERAIALRSAWGFAAPVASAAGAIAAVFGAIALAHAAWIVAPLALVAVSVALVRRQPALHTALLAVAALAWACGDVLFAMNGDRDAVAAWWFAFLVLTIAAERLEMTRLMKRRAAATPLFLACVGALLAGAGVSIVAPATGALLYGAALVATAAWLAAFDLARRTIRGEGFARYAAAGLLGGYAWLGLGGIAWASMPAATLPLRDAALHAVGLGFVVSMIFAHAPLVVPVIARRPLRFTRLFYAPLVLLHVSLVLRLTAGIGDAGARAAGGLLNAAVFALFIATVLFSLFSRTSPAASPRA